MVDAETVGVQALTGLAREALIRAGVAGADAEASAEILVTADTLGIPTHGVVRIPEYVNRIELGGVDARAEIGVDERSPSMALVEGNRGLGTVVGTRALETAMRLVAGTGIAWVGCRDSNHLGALAPYALRACDAGLVMLAGTNASTTMIPWGGNERRMGNNPLCIAAPCARGPHFVLDMAMSVAARGKIRAAKRAGLPIPDTWAVDEAGNPTTDPDAALAGSLLPIGGHKGSGLSMGVDLLAGVLSGAGFLSGVSSWSLDPGAPSRLGHFFLLIDPARLLGAGAFDGAMERFAAIVAGTPPLDPASPVCLPGQREQERRRAALEEGVRVPGDLLATIRELAGA